MGTAAVVVMAALAVGREGLETAVFFFAAAQAAGETTEPLIGFLLGIAVAIVLAYLIYRGAMQLNLGKFFTVTGVLLIFVAAGILAYGVHDLQEAAILPGLNTLAFDVSAAVPPDSWYGTLLKGIFNFSPQTTVARGDRLGRLRRRRPAAVPAATAHRPAGPDRRRLVLTSA